ncbi:MAG: metal ABC transporter substrate-binding protein, partial [Dehalococcoidia bacterium]
MNSPDRLSEASRRLRPLWPLLLFVIAVAACGGDSDAPTPTAIVSRSTDPIKVVVTLPVFADFVREIGGENVEVASLIPEGVDPHTYEPRLEDANLVVDADIILVNGLGLEGPALDFITEHRASGLTNLVTIAANVPSPTAEQPVDKPIFATEAGDDPHLWLDPKLARIYPETVADSLKIADGKNEDYYEATFRAYLERLQELDREIAQTIEAIPLEGRKLVTYHSSLVHFARRYGLDVVGVVTEDTARTPPPGKI